MTESLCMLCRLLQVASTGGMVLRQDPVCTAGFAAPRWNSLSACFLAAMPSVTSAWQSTLLAASPARSAGELAVHPRRPLHAPLYSLHVTGVLRCVILSESACAVLIGCCEVSCMAWYQWVPAGSCCLQSSWSCPFLAHKHIDEASVCANFIWSSSQLCHRPDLAATSACSAKASA